MNMTKKLVIMIFLMVLFSGVLSLPIIIIWTPLSWSHIHSAIMHGETARLRDFIPFLSIIGLIGGFSTASGILYYVILNLVRPVKVAAEFADAIATGEQPPILKFSNETNNEIDKLYSALNILRDRQQNFTRRLRDSIEREAEIRRELDHRQTLYSSILSRMLPELRDPLDIINVYSRTLENENNAPFPSKEVLTEVQKNIENSIDSLSRQIGRILDISRLEKKHWKYQNSEPFDTAEFLHELMNFTSSSLLQGSMSMVNYYSANAPTMLCLDRELLLELLNISIRVIARSSGKGEVINLTCTKEEDMTIFELKDSKKSQIDDNLLKEYNYYLKTDLNNEDLLLKVSLATLGLLYVKDSAIRMGAKFYAYSTETSNIVIKIAFSEAVCMSKNAQWAHSSWLEQSTIKSINEIYSSSPEQTKTRAKIAMLSPKDDENRTIPIVLKFNNIDTITFKNEDEFISQTIQDDTLDAIIISDCIGREKTMTLIDKIRESNILVHLPIIVCTSMYPDELSRQISMLENVSYVIKPLNFNLLSTTILRG